MKIKVGGRGGGGDFSVPPFRLIPGNINNVKLHKIHLDYCMIVVAFPQRRGLYRNRHTKQKNKRWRQLEL